MNPRPMNLRAWLVVATIAGMFPVFGAGSAEGAARPNVMVILCDDLGYGDLACYGNPTIKTPNLDRLAGQGIRLTDCYASAPVCSPSRAGLLTGRTPSRVGVYDWIPDRHPVHLRSGEITVAALLKQAGYATCHVGKWHCNGKFNSTEQPQPGDHGFDHWFATQNNAAPTHHNPVNFVRNGKPVGKIEGYSCGIVADEAIDWLREGRDKSKPFFTFVCFHEPHEPIDSPPELVKLYPKAKKRGQALHYANVTNMDRAVGRLMKALDEMDLADDTLVFFTSDNGPETLDRYRAAWRSHGSPGPLRGMKLHIYDGGIRVPGILRWPGKIAPGQVVDEPVCGLDVLPTLCELVSVETPADRALDGASFTPVFEGKSIRREQPLFWHYYRALGKPKVAMRDGDWKLVAHWDAPDRPPGRNVDDEAQKVFKSARLVRFELYNVRDDIAESRDLATSEPKRLAQMSKTCKKLYSEVLAEGPVWKVPPRPARPKKKAKPAK